MGKTKELLIEIMQGDEELGLYEEPKQETLDEIEIISKKRIHKYRPMNPHPMSFSIGFNDGIEWQSERMYSEIHLILDNILYWDTCPDSYKISIKKWLEQFKKK